MNFLIALMVVFQQATACFAMTPVPILALAPAPASDAFSQRTRVYIYNEMPYNEKLTVHCKSDFNDLGTITLSFGEFYSWTIPILMPRDKYDVNCDLTWKYADKWFNIYHSYRDRARCPNECTWIATGDGILGFTEKDGTMDVRLPWV